MTLSIPSLVTVDDAAKWTEFHSEVGWMIKGSFLSFLVPVYDYLLFVFNRRSASKSGVHLDEGNGKYTSPIRMTMST